MAINMHRCAWTYSSLACLRNENTFFDSLDNSLYNFVVLTFLAFGCLPGLFLWLIYIPLILFCWLLSKEHPLMQFTIYGIVSGEECAITKWTPNYYGELRCCQE